MKPEELGAYLLTIRNVIANDLRPGLKSVHLNAAAGSVVVLLDRLVTTLKTGDGAAAARLGEWNEISAELEHLGFGTSRGAGAPISATGLPYEALESRYAAVQNNIGRGAGFDQLTAKLASHDRATMEWYAKSVAALVDFAEAGEPQVPAPRAPAGSAQPQDETEVLRGKLSVYLARRFPSLPKDAIARFAIAPGGHVKQTAIFALVPNEILPTRLVLRRDLSDSITGTTVIDEFPIIERAFSLGLPVPKPIFLEKDREPLDGAFMVMTEVTDAVGAGTYFPEERRLAPRTVGPEYGHDVASVLARLHSGTATKGGKAVDFTEQVKKHYASWCALQSPPFSLSMELSYAWLLSHPLPPDRPQCFVHGDIGSHNIMVRDGRLVALLDWELAADGDPAVDLALCRMMLLPDTMPWPEFKQEYIAAGGDPVACDESAVAYYCVWTYLKHGLMNATLRNLYLQGGRDDLVAAVVGGHYFHRLMQYQGRALQIAVDSVRGDR